MSTIEITRKRTAARLASAVALFAAAGILTAAIAAAPASAMNEMTRFWSGDLTKRHSADFAAFMPSKEAFRPPVTRLPKTGGQMTRYWSGQLTDRRQVLQDLALAESIAIHTADEGVTPTIEARAVESHPKFWANPNARR